MNNKNFFIVIITLAIVAIVGFISYLPTRIDSDSSVKVEKFPKKIGRWSSTEIPLSEKDYEILETRNLILREYKKPREEPVTLYIIYSEDNRKVSHPPEVCYLGSGVTVADKSKIQLTDSVAANRLLLEKADARQLVVYWYKAGGLNTDKYLKQQLKIVTDRMLAKRTSGALIRLSVDIVKDNEKAAIELIKSFYAQIENDLEKYVP